MFLEFFGLREYHSRIPSSTKGASKLAHSAKSLNLSFFFDPMKGESCLAIGYYWRQNYHIPFLFIGGVVQKNSRRVWRSRRRKSSSVPAGAATFPAAVFLAGKCPNLGRDSISRCRKIGESSSSSVEICRKTFPAGNFGQP